MSKRAIICPCGLAKPCEKPDCQHSTALALRNKVIQKNNRDARVKKVREALDALQSNEWEEVMAGRCQFCGLMLPCACRGE